MEFLQNNIARMSSCSANEKNIEIAIISSILAIYAAQANTGCISNKKILLIAIVPTILFCFLDAYYLSLEKSFRDLYNEIAAGTSTVKIFEIPIGKNKSVLNTIKSILVSMTSLSVYPFYGGIIIMMVILYFAL